MRDTWPLELRVLGLAAIVGAAGCDPASARGTSASGASGSSRAPLSDVSVQQPKIDFALPAFQLVDHREQPFDQSKLLGKITVTDFIFTTCPAICPGLTRKMSALVKKLEGDPEVQFLSITVDAENDTPAKLAAFAAEHGTPSPHWYFVTGDPKVVDDTVIKGFMMAVQRGSARADISHAERFVVVDERAHVRGLYDTDAAGLDALEARIQELKAE